MAHEYEVLVVVMSRKGGRQNHSETRTPAAHNHPKHKVHAYWPPWLAGPLVLVLGNLGHTIWAVPPASSVVPMAVVLSTFGLSALTHKYASPRNNVQQWHAVLSVAVLGLSLSAVLILGTGWPVPNGLGQAVLFLSSVLALSWNIRRFEVVRGEGQDKHGQDSAEEEWHGLKKPRSLKVTSSDGKKTQAKVKLAAGQTAKDVEAVLGAMGSSLGTVTSGIRVEKGKHEGDVELTMLWEDTLTEAVGWNGPEHVGGSIADPISLGTNEQGKPVILLLAGDYDAGIAPAHLALVGEPRTGKGVCVIVIWTNLRGRRDVYPVINDHAKGEQMLMFLRPGMPKEKAWIDTTKAGAKVQAAAVMRAIDVRNKALGAAGFSSWEPKAFTEGIMWRGQRIHMPALVFHLEEFAPIGTASPQLFTTIGEQGLSAGIFLITSLQRASGTRFPTDLRSVIGNGVCYGAHSDMDVSFALSDETVAGGVTPAQWGTKFPGRAMAELNGAESGMARIPFKTHYARSKEEFESYVKEVMAYLLPLAPDLDPCTAEAFGQPYQDYLASDDTTAPTTQPRASKATSGTEEDDDEEEGEMDDDEEFVVPHLELENEIPDWTGPDVDFSPPPRPGLILGETSPERKREVFREILQACADRGEAAVTTGRLNDLWVEQFGYPKANQSPTISRFLVDATAEDLGEDGKPNDLMGSVEPDERGRGHWLIKLRPRVAALNGHGPK